MSPCLEEAGCYFQSCLGLWLALSPWRGPSLPRGCGDTCLCLCWGWNAGGPGEVWAVGQYEEFQVEGYVSHSISSARIWVPTMSSKSNHFAVFKYLSYTLIYLFIYFLRGHLSYLLIKWLLTTIKFCIWGSMLNAQSLIHLKPSSRQSPIF